MDLLTYVRGVKTFKKSQLIEKLDTVMVIARDLHGNIERLEANKIDLGHEINQWIISKSVLRFLESSGYRGVTFNHAMKTALMTVQAMVPVLSKLVKSDRNEVWDGKILNLRQANLLNIVEHTEHWLKFTGLVYDVLLTLHNKKVQAPESHLAKSDARWLNGTVEFYKTTTVELLKGSRILIQALEAVPEIDVTEGSLSVLEATETDAPIDMMKQGFGVHQLNPVFWISLGRMNYNLARIDKARRDNELFAMKISQAANLKNGTDDAQLDEQIAVYQDEIIKNVNLIEEIEKNYA